VFLSHKEKPLSRLNGGQQIILDLGQHKSTTESVTVGCIPLSDLVSLFWGPTLGPGRRQKDMLDCPQKLMALRKTSQLAYCEYVSRDPNNSTEVWAARLRLIDSARRVYPKLLKDLLSDVFPKYQLLAKTVFDFDRILWSSRISPTKEIAQKRELQELTSALLMWARKFNAEVLWFTDEALRTLRGWYVAPDWQKTLRWNSIHGFSGSTSMGRRFAFECEGWETELLTWIRYSQSVRERFQEQLKQYEIETRKLAESCGLIRARRKYSPDNLDWFVLYQFAGLSSGQIANWSANRGNSVDESTVLKGIKVAAKLIDWKPLRLQKSRRNRKIC
jgi:hypothetical protein